MVTFLEELELSHVFEGIKMRKPPILGGFQKLTGCFLDNNLCKRESYAAGNNNTD